jgi:drug/metabolite transporter (DMT)-like permease
MLFRISDRSYKEPRMFKALSRESLGLLLGTIGVIIFGVTLPMTRIAVQSLDPWFVTSGRAALAGLVAIVVLTILRRPWPNRSELLPLSIGAFFTIIGFPGCTGFAMQLVPASHGGVVLGILPLVVALFGALSSGDRPSLGFWLSALVGAALVVGFSLRDEAGQLGLGDLLLLGAVLSAAAGYTAFNRVARTRAGWEVVSWAVVIGLPVTIPVAFLTAPVSPVAIPLTHWGAFLYLGLMSQYIGFFFWNSGLAIGGQARVSQTQLLQAFVTLATAALINGESVDIWTWIFAIAVVASVLVGRRAKIIRGQ